MDTTGLHIGIAEGLPQVQKPVLEYTTEGGKIGDGNPLCGKDVPLSLVPHLAGVVGASATEARPPHKGDGDYPLTYRKEKMRLLDTFCKAGGTTKGYQRAGFDVVGVDIEPQPHYCGDAFIQADALDVLYALAHGDCWVVYQFGFDGAETP